MYTWSVNQVPVSGDIGVRPAEGAPVWTNMGRIYKGGKRFRYYHAIANDLEGPTIFQPMNLEALDIHKNDDGEINRS